MKKDFKLFEEVSDDELKVNGGGFWAITIPISLSLCPSAQCVSIAKPCNK